MRRPGKLVLLEWTDSTGHGQRWKYGTDVRNVPGMVSTVGWIIKEDQRCITVASAIGDHSLSVPDHELEYGGLHTIVKACIYQRRVLREDMMAKKQTKSQQKVGRAMREVFKHKPSTATKKEGRKQLVAIGLSKARARGARVPKK